MIKSLNLGIILSASLISSSVFAAPQYLITHNRTNVESDAYVITQGGTIPSGHPTKANSDGQVMWGLVKLICFGNIVNNSCSALIKMETNTSHPVELGKVTMNLDTGDITPKSLVANGYALTVNNPGEVTLSYAK